MSTLTKKKTVRLQPKPASRTPRNSSRATTQDALLTVDDWLALPDTKPRYELIEGKLIQDMTTTSDHAWAAGQFIRQCFQWDDQQEFQWKFFPEGMGYKADLNNGFVPDVVGFQPDQDVPNSINHMPTPFLAVEVLSPGTAKRDRTFKRNFYAKGGVQLYLIIDPANRTLEVYRLANGEYAVPEVLAGKDIWQPEELPGLQLELAKLWMN